MPHFKMSGPVQDSALSQNDLSQQGLGQKDLVDVYLTMRPRLERVIARRVGSPTMASDLAQNIFLRIGSITVPMASRGDAERYFMRIAINASLDYLKVEHRRAVILDEASPIFQGTYHSPESDALASDDMRQVEAALAELPPHCRDVLLLSRLEGYSNAEIAKRLRVSISLVEKHLRRSLLHCRQRLAQESGRC